MDEMLDPCVCQRLPINIWGYFNTADIFMIAWTHQFYESIVGSWPSYPYIRVGHEAVTIYRIAKML